MEPHTHLLRVGTGRILRVLYINPLVTDPQYLVCMAKISILKEEEIIEKNFYERRAYESVDDRNYS